MIHHPSLHTNWTYHSSQNLGNIGVGSLTLLLFNNNSIHLVFDTLEYILPGQKSVYLAPIRKETHDGHRDGVRCWIPLEDININNSAPIVIPGSHLWTEECFMGHGSCALCFASSLKDTPKCACNSELLNNQNKWNTQIFDDLKKGDIIFINPKTLHSIGGPNKPETSPLVNNELIKPIAFNNCDKNNINFTYYCINNSNTHTIINNENVIIIQQI